MTPGQEALAEAMRLEQARLYSETVESHRARVQPAHHPAVLVEDDDLALDGRVERGKSLARVVELKRAAS